MAPRLLPQALDEAENRSALAVVEVAAAGSALALLSCCAAAACSVAGLGQAQPRLAAAKPQHVAPLWPPTPLSGRPERPPAGPDVLLCSVRLEEEEGPRAEIEDFLGG